MRGATVCTAVLLHGNEGCLTGFRASSDGSVKAKLKALTHTFSLFFVIKRRVNRKPQSRSVDRPQMHTQICDDVRPLLIPLTTLAFCGVQSANRVI